MNEHFLYCTPSRKSKLNLIIVNTKNTVFDQTTHTSTGPFVLPCTVEYTRPLGRNNKSCVKQCWVRNEVEGLRISSEWFGIDFANYLCSGIDINFLMVHCAMLTKW